MKQKRRLCCTHSLCETFLGKNTTGGWRGKKICQKKNDGAETFSPGDFLRHGGHEGSGYSAV